MSPPPPTSFQVPELVSWSCPAGVGSPMSVQVQASGQMAGGGWEPGSEARLSTTAVEVWLEL